MPNVGDLKVWYVPQVPMPAFEVYVPDMKTAALILDTLGLFSDFELEHKVKPDYCDAGGIVRYEEDGDGFGWFDVDDEEWQVA